MNKQHFINGQAKFPVSTEALDFIQNQIFLTARLCSIAGTNVIIAPATPTTEGLVVINGELLPLLAGTAKSYIQVVETKQTIVAGTQTFTDVRITRYAQYANSGTPVSQFTTIDNIVRLMQRIIAIEGSYMTETAIRQLVQTVQNNLNTTNTNLTTTNSNLTALTTRVKNIENTYKTATEINDLLAANAKHHLPKGSIIDWYGSNLNAATVPEGFVPCGYFACTEAEENNWKKKFSSIGTTNKTLSGTRYVYIYQANGQSVPDLTDRFIVQAGYSYAKGATGGANEVKLTADQSGLPKHNHEYQYAAEVGGSVKHDGYTSIVNLKHYKEKTVETGGTDATEPHENRPPYYALYKLIKVI